jgi:diaminopimelate epimerase
MNVEFVRVRNNKELDVRVIERGSGETLACGTGACAAAVAAIFNGMTERNVTVHLPGGDLRVQWKSDLGPVFMTGPATEVFRGEYTWEK